MREAPERPARAAMMRTGFLPNLCMANETGIVQTQAPASMAPSGTVARVSPASSRTARVEIVT